MSSSLPVVVMVALYAAVGVGWALWMLHQGQPTAAAWSAVFAWPLLLGGGAEPTPAATGGPYSARIAQAVSSLAQMQAEVQRESGDALGLVSEVELTRILQALERSDARLARADRWLAQEPPGEARDTLKRARDAAASQLEGLLQQLAGLRVQLGLVALAGDSQPVQARLREIRERLAVMEEIGLP